MNYSPQFNCRLPTFFQNGPPIGGATLRNPATLISSAPCRGVVDALKLRRLFSIFPFYEYFLLLAQRGTFYMYTIIVPDAKKWPMLKNFTTLLQFPPHPRRGVADAYLQRRQFHTGE